MPVSARLTKSLQKGHHCGPQVGLIPAQPADVEDVLGLLLVNKDATQGLPIGLLTFCTDI